MSRRAVSLILGAAAALYALCEAPTARGHPQPPAMRRFVGSKANKRLLQEVVANDQIQNAQVVDLDDGLRGDAIGPSASIRNSFSVSLGGSVTGASPDPENSECGGSASSPGVWYSFRVPESSSSSWSLTVDTCKSSLDTVMGLLSGACATANDTGCSCVGTNDDGCGRGAYGSRISSRVSGGSDFLALVRSYDSQETGTFELTLSATVLPPPPENDAIQRAATVLLEREPTAAGNSTLPRSTATVTVEGTLLSASSDSSVCSSGFGRRGRSGRAGVWYRVDVNETSALSVEVTSEEWSMRASILKGSECLSTPSSPPCSCLTSWATKEQTVVASPSAYLIWIFADEDAAVDERRSAFTLTLAVSVLLPPPENDAIERAATVLLEREPTTAGNSTLPGSTATVTVEGTLLSASSDASVCSSGSGRGGVWYRVDVNETSALSVEVISDKGEIGAHLLKGGECLSAPYSPPCACLTDGFRSARAITVRAPQSTYFLWVFADGDAALLERTSAFNLTVSLAVLPPPPANTVIGRAAPLSLMGNPLGSSSISGSFLSSSPTAAASVCGEGGGSEGAGLWYRVEVTERGVLSLHLKARTYGWGFNVVRGGSCSDDPSAPGCTCIHAEGKSFEYETLVVDPDLYFVSVFTRTSRQIFVSDESEFSLQGSFLKEGTIHRPSSVSELTLDAPVSGEVSSRSAQHFFSFVPRGTSRVAFTLCSSLLMSLNVTNASQTLGFAEINVCTGCAEVWVDMADGVTATVAVSVANSDNATRERIDFFALSAGELPVPPAGRWDGAFKLEGNQSVDFSTSVVPGGLYREGYSVYWFSHESERRKGLSLKLCRTRERDSLLREAVPQGLVRFLSEATCNYEGCDFFSEESGTLVLQSDRVSEDVEGGQSCSVWFRRVDTDESVLLAVLQTSIPLQAEFAGSLTLDVTEFDLHTNSHPQTASQLPLSGEVLVDTSFAFSIPYAPKSLFPANLTDASGLWYCVEVPEGRPRVAVSVELCAESAHADEATVDMRVCSEGAQNTSCRTVVKQDVSRHLAVEYPALYAAGCSEETTLKTVLYQGEHLSLGVGTMYENRGMYKLTVKDAELLGACVEDTRFADRDGDGCEVYEKFPDFCNGAEQLASCSSEGGRCRGARDTCCACIGTPAPSEAVTLLNGTCPQGTRRKLNACLAFDVEPIERIGFARIRNSGTPVCNRVLQESTCLSGTAVLLKGESTPAEVCAEAAENGRVALSLPQLFCGDESPSFRVGPNDQCCRERRRACVLMAPITSISGCPATVDGSGQVCQRSEVRVEGLLQSEDSLRTLPDMD